ncbi:serine hydrolase domain-containing protein [Aquimarina sp. 2201CG5-10]|uniref:serine hydrolase domain-containing protein n=1 Tax=Aquimarina callyspongiae TaxID=3098150 RepID=UPI002AB4FE31|nr:serine hydrolase domain-containing protein [Aquimarina sp. 2201CG5-10]MDY8135894.1 serine hydrolase domain-containing protein [Aquimarina sp. 2201CG5-10]
MSTLVQFIIILILSVSIQAQTIKTPIGTSIETSEIEALLEKQMASNRTPGASLAIINDGKIVFHTVKGYSAPGKEVTKKTIFEGASLSKPLFGFFVMKFVEKGLLDLDTPLYKYLPYKDIAHDSRYKKITARMVLAHKTGFPNWRTDTNSDTLFLDFEPGTKFQYSGEGYQYLALVLQNILKTDAKGLERYFHEEVAKPLGLKTIKYLQDKNNLKNKARAFKDGNWIAHRDFGDTEFGAAYGVHSEANDWATWMIALMNKKGLKKDSYLQLFENQTELPEDNVNRSSGITYLTLGFYTGVFPFGNVYGHGGNNNGEFTSLFFFHPTSKWGAVLFTNSSFGEEMGIQLFQYLLTNGK